MKNFMHLLKMNQTTDNPAPGTPAAPAAPNPADKIDGVPSAADLGYDVDPEPVKAPDAPAAPAAPAKAPDAPAEPEKSSTGYGEEPPKVDAEPAAPAAPAAPDVKVDLGYEIKIDDKVITKEEVKAASEFAKQHLSKTSVEAFAKDAGLSEEQTNKLLERDQKIFQTYLDGMTKDKKGFLAAQEQAAKDAERAKVEMRASWHKQLKDDPNFGGEKFGANVKLANRVFDQFMPETKKILTERGSVLPPYVMRDLVKMAEQLFDTDKLQTGAAPAPAAPKEENDPLSFYN